MIRLYAPVIVLLTWVGVSALGVSCPIGFSVVFALSLVLHLRALVSAHFARYARHHRRAWPTR